MTAPESQLATPLTFSQIPQARLVALRWLVCPAIQLEGQHRCIHCRHFRNHSFDMEAQRRPRIQTQDARARPLFPEPIVRWYKIKYLVLRWFANGTSVGASKLLSTSKHKRERRRTHDTKDWWTKKPLCTHRPVCEIEDNYKFLVCSFRNHETNHGLRVHSQSAGCSEISHCGTPINTISTIRLPLKSRAQQCNGKTLHYGSL